MHGSKPRNQERPFIILRITDVYVKTQREINLKLFLIQQEKGRNLNTMSDTKPIMTILGRSSRQSRQD